MAAYQNQSYADRYSNFVEKVSAAESQAVSGSTDLSDAVARSLYKLMAYKDEYEVARLYTDGRFKQALENQFQDGGTVKFHLAPPLFAKRDPDTGHLIKQEFGGWVFGAFKFLARLKGLRGTKFDPFGYSEERKSERNLIEDYKHTVDELLSNLSPENIGHATEIAELAMTVRGFGHVKEENLKRYQTQLPSMLRAYKAGDHPSLAAAE